MPCPFMLLCKKTVNYLHFKSMCLSDNYSYEDCEEFKKLSQVKKTPIEWLKIEKQLEKEEQ